MATSRLIKRAIAFPGQGTQKPGMLADFQNQFPKIVNPILEQVDETLNEPFSKYALLDKATKQEDLSSTEIAQPLLLVYSYTVYQIIKASHPQISFDYTLGHSLGEYSAYTCSGVLSITDAVWLVKKRGLGMKRATENYIEKTGTSIGMTAIFIDSNDKLPMVSDHINSFIQTKNYSKELSLAIFNAPNQLVLSGCKPAINSCIESLNQVTPGIKTKDLSVSGPFHSPIMEPVQNTMRDILDSHSITFNWPPNGEEKIISNITAQPMQSIDEVKTSIIDTLIKPVHWSQSFDYLVEQGVNNVISIGLGKYARNATLSKDINFIYAMNPNKITTI